MLKKVILSVIASLLITTNCALAMSFSQPLKIGWIGISQKDGGFACRNASSNNGDYYTVYNKNNKFSYGKGTAKFGKDKDALYVFYDVYTDNDIIRIGGADRKNTVTISILNDWIYKIESDDGITLYPIRFWYGPESDWRIIGTQKNGKYVKYVDTVEITEKYFGFDIRNGPSPVLYDIPICKGDTIIIKYKGHTSKNNIGEFRFKWDNNAQWFSVEQVVY